MPTTNVVSRRDTCDAIANDDHMLNSLVILETSNHAAPDGLWFFRFERDTYCPVNSGAAGHTCVFRKAESIQRAFFIAISGGKIFHPLQNRDWISATHAHTATSFDVKA